MNAAKKTATRTITIAANNVEIGDIIDWTGRWVQVTDVSIRTAPTLRRGRIEVVALHCGQVTLIRELGEAVTIKVA